jgi:hypothetical protein
MWHTITTHPTPNPGLNPRHRRPEKVHHEMAVMLVGRQSKSRPHRAFARCQGEKRVKDQVVPWTTDGLGSPDGNRAWGPVSKIVDSCQHPVTTAGQD